MEGNRHWWRERHGPTPAELQTAWQGHADAIETWYVSSGQTVPLMFSEVGYRSADGANREPWAWWGDATVDLQEQVDCYEALLSTLWAEDWWAGAFWWPSYGGRKGSS